MLLDLDQGSMTVWKNDERLGVMQARRAERSALLSGGAARSGDQGAHRAGAGAPHSDGGGAHRSRRVAGGSTPRPYVRAATGPALKTGESSDVLMNDHVYTISHGSHIHIHIDNHSCGLTKSLVPSSHGASPLFSFIVRSNARSEPIASIDRVGD